MAGGYPRHKALHLRPLTSQSGYFYMLFETLDLGHNNPLKFLEKSKN